MKLTKERELTISIIAEFEQLLEQKGIKIPSSDREGNEDEANIYGSEYWQLEENITEILEKHLKAEAKNAERQALFYNQYAEPVGYELLDIDAFGLSEKEIKQEVKKIMRKKYGLEWEGCSNNIYLLNTSGLEPL